MNNCYTAVPVCDVRNLQQTTNKKAPDLLQVINQGHATGDPAMPCEPRCLNLHMQVGAFSRVSAWLNDIRRELLHPLSVYSTPICEALAQHWQAHHAHSRDDEILTQSESDDKVVTRFIADIQVTNCGAFR